MNCLMIGMLVAGESDGVGRKTGGAQCHETGPNKYREERATADQSGANQSSAGGSDQRPSGREKADRQTTPHKRPEQKLIRASFGGTRRRWMGRRDVGEVTLRGGNKRLFL